MNKYGFVGPIGGRVFDFDSMLNELLNLEGEPVKDPKAPEKNSNIMNMFMGTLKSDIKETETSFVVEAELPGFDKKDIQVDVEDGVLTITAEKAKTEEEKSEKYIRRERYAGKWYRSYTFEGIDNEAVKAKYENGILIVELPKVQKNVVKKGINID